MDLLKLAFNEDKRNEMSSFEYWTNRRYNPEATGQAHEVEQGDYMKDGMLYCGRCNGAKFIWNKVLNMWWRTPCICEKKAFDNYKLAEKKDNEARYIRYLRQKGIPEGRLRDYTFENDTSDGQYYQTYGKPYIENFDKMFEEGLGYFIYGPKGTGKTFLAVAIANALIDRMIPCKVTNFATIADEMQGTYIDKSAYMDELMKNHLLVIDDFGIERDTKFMDEIVYKVINKRYELRKPLIITSNLTSEQLNHPDESMQRITSRIKQMCGNVKTEGADQRLRRDV